MKHKPNDENQHKKQIEAIMHDPSYQLAEEDKGFIYSNDARSIRLQLDYLKAEIKMQQEGIDHTVVVFGSARIVEFETAMERLGACEKALSQDPHCERLLNDLKKAESMVRKSVYYDEARKLGQLVGSSGKGAKDCKVTLMTGGGPGIMEAANRGAFDVGAKSIGLNIQLSHEQFPNPYISPDLCFQFRYFAIRKLHFMQRAKALVVFPGGFGTMDELFEVLTLIQTKKTPTIPVILVGRSYWERLIDFDFLQEENVIEAEDLASIHYAENANEAWEIIEKWDQTHKAPTCNLP